MDESERQDAIERKRRRCTPMPDRCVRVAMQRTFTPDEWRRIREGFLPEAMEDKWFIFVEGGAIHFHRSWSGLCIYKVPLRPVGDSFATDGALVNRHPKQSGGADDDDYDLALIDFLIGTLLLGRHQPFPLPRGMKPAGPDAGLFQHFTAGTGYPQIPLPDKPGKDG